MIAHAAYREHLAAKGPDLKIGKDYRLAEYIERRIVEDGFSPAAVLGEIKVKGRNLYVVSDYDQMLPVYKESGVFYGLFHINKGTNWLSGLPSGIYIINNTRIRVS